MSLEKDTKHVITGGFTIDQLFEEVERLKKKAKKGDSVSKKILDSAHEKWEESGRYAY